MAHPLKSTFLFCEYFPPFTLSMIRSTSPQISTNVSSTRLINFPLFRFVATNFFRPFFPPLHPSTVSTAYQNPSPLSAQPIWLPRQCLALVLFWPFRCVHRSSHFPSKSVSYSPTERVFLICRRICFPPTFLSLTYPRPGSFRRSLIVDGPFPSLP